MVLSRRNLLATTGTALTLSLAGCSGELSEPDEETTTTTTTPTETETTEGSDTTEEAENTTDSEVVLGTRTTDRYGDVVVGPDGMSLYMFEKDPNDAGESVCTGDCAEAWPPLTVDEPEAVSSADAVSGSVDTVERSDGSYQVTLGGWPLYFFQQDSAPGDVAGQGVVDAWWLVDPNGMPIEPVVQARSHAELGSILTGPDGLTIYMFDKDAQGSGESACTGGCEEAWPPLTVEPGKTLLKSQAVSAEIGTIERDDGSIQVTVAGWPVYYYQNDESEGDVTGQGVQDAWWVLDRDGTVIRSNGSTTEKTQTTTTTTTTKEDSNDDDDGGGGVY